MPVPTHVTHRYGVKDAKVYAVTKDDDQGYAYGPGIDVPGIKSVTLDAATATKELRGDNSLLHSQTALTGISGTIAFAKDSLDVVAAAFGLTVVEGSDTASITILGDSTPQPLRLEGLAASSDIIGGDVMAALSKIYMTPILGFAEEDYALYSVPFTAAPTTYVFPPAGGDPGGRKWVQQLNSSIPLTLASV